MNALAFVNCSLWTVNGVVLKTPQLASLAGWSALISLAALGVRGYVRWRGQTVIPDEDYRAALQDGSRLSRLILCVEQVVLGGCCSIPFERWRRDGVLFQRRSFVDSSRSKEAAALPHVGGNGRRGPTGRVQYVPHCCTVAPEETGASVHGGPVVAVEQASTISSPSVCAETPGESCEPPPTSLECGEDWPITISTTCTTAAAPTTLEDVFRATTV